MSGWIRTDENWAEHDGKIKRTVPKRDLVPFVLPKEPFNRNGKLYTCLCQKETLCNSSLQSSKYENHILLVACNEIPHWVAFLRSRMFKVKRFMRIVTLGTVATWIAAFS